MVSFFSRRVSYYHLLELLHQRDLKEANIVELKRVLAITAIDDNTVQVRHYEVPKITEDGVLANDI